MKTFTKLISIMGVVGGLFVSLIGTAESTHLYTIDRNKWSSDTVNYCNGDNLKNLYIDGGTGKKSKVESEVDAVKSYINGLNSDWTLNKVGEGCMNDVGAKDILINGIRPTGITWIKCQGSSDDYDCDDGENLRELDTNFNTYYKWSTGSCDSSPPPYHLKSTARHEFGHWVKMLDTDEDRDTVMWYAYDCSIKSKWWSHDVETIGNVYGR